MTVWFLIITLTVYKGGGLTHIGPFETKQECLASAEEVEKLTEWNKEYLGHCIPVKMPK